MSSDEGHRGRPGCLRDPTGPLARILPGNGPVMAVALHTGHDVRPDVSDHLLLREDDRLREEDPFTARMVPAGMPHMEVLRSRFEVDLNRERSRAVYQGPSDAWGLDLYRAALPADIEEDSRRIHDVFYRGAFEFLSHAARRHDRFVVLDLHSYNHRRGGPSGSPAPAEENPEVNLGTGWLDEELWRPQVAAFSETMRSAGFDCRENVKFRGGYFARWVAQTFPGSGAALAIEFKKTYMDEWSGRVDRESVARIRRALADAAAAITRTLADGV